MPRTSKRQKTETMENGNGTSSSHPWADLPAQLTSAIPVANKAAQTDAQLAAFTITNAIEKPATFGIKAAGNPATVRVTVTNGKADIRAGDAEDCLFVLSALPEQWQEFFKQTPVAPYQSYWGMLRQGRASICYS